MKFPVKFLKIIFFSVLFFVCTALFSAPRGAQELVLSDSWIYDALTQVSLDAGIYNFTDDAPLTIQEITVYMNAIPYETLSAAGKKQYDRIKRYFAEQNISFDSGVFSLGIDPAVTGEGYYKTNDSLDWIYDRYSRKPLIDVPLTLSGKDFFTMMCDIELSENQGVMSHDDNYTNIPAAANEIDVNFPHTAYFSTGYKFADESGVSFQLGIFDKSIGRTQTGSIIWSDYFTGATYGQLSFYSPNFKYTGSVSQFDVDKYMYTHLFQGRFFDKLTFSVMEGMLVYAPIELRYLNPFTIFHGMAPWRDYGEEESNTCAYMCFKLNYVPVKHVRIYGLFAQDQYQTPYELEHWPDSLTPNGLGGQLGIESYLPLQDGFFHVALEGYYADPYLYIKESPNWSLARTYAENIGDMAVFYEWVGSPFGPDTISGELSLGYEKPGRWSADLMYLYMCRGELSGTNTFDAVSDVWGGTDTDITDDEVNSDWAYPTTENGNSPFLTTPTGTPEYVNRLSVRVTWLPENWLSVTAQPGFVLIFNHNNTEGDTAYGFEFALSVNLSFHNGSAS
jgi:hypothetical protein